MELSGVMLAAGVLAAEGATVSLAVCEDVAVGAADELTVCGAVGENEADTVAAAVMEELAPRVTDAVAVAVDVSVRVSVVEVDTDELMLADTLALGVRLGESEGVGGQLALGTPDRASTRTARMTRLIQSRICSVPVATSKATASG